MEDTGRALEAVEFRRWYRAVGDHTFRSVELRISRDEASALLTLNRKRHKAGEEHYKTLSEHRDPDSGAAVGGATLWGGVGADEASALEALAERIDDVLSEEFAPPPFGLDEAAGPGGTAAACSLTGQPQAFAKLGNACAKDAAARWQRLEHLYRARVAVAPPSTNMHLQSLIWANANAQRVGSGHEVLDLFADSELVHKELDLYLNVLRRAPPPIVLREWAAVDPAFEFRGFVVNNVLTLVTQLSSMGVRTHYPQTLAMKADLEESVQRFFAEHLRDPLRSVTADAVEPGAYVIDLYFDVGHGKWVVVDINPLDDGVALYPAPFEFRLPEITKSCDINDSSLPSQWKVALETSTDVWDVVVADEPARRPQVDSAGSGVVVLLVAGGRPSGQRDYVRSEINDTLLEAFTTFTDDLGLPPAAVHVLVSDEAEVGQFTSRGAASVAVSAPDTFVAALQKLPSLCPGGTAIVAYFGHGKADVRSDDFADANIRGLQWFTEQMDETSNRAWLQFSKPARKLIDVYTDGELGHFVHGAVDELELTADGRAAARPRMVDTVEYCLHWHALARTLVSIVSPGDHDGKATGVSTTVGAGGPPPAPPAAATVQPLKRVVAFIGAQYSGGLFKWLPEHSLDADQLIAVDAETSIMPALRKSDAAAIFPGVAYEDIIQRCATAPIYALTSSTHHYAAGIWAWHAFIASLRGLVPRDASTTLAQFYAHLHSRDPKICAEPSGKGEAMDVAALSQFHGDSSLAYLPLSALFGNPLPPAPRSLARSVSSVRSVSPPPLPPAAAVRRTAAAVTVESDSDTEAETSSKQSPPTSATARSRPQHTPARSVRTATEIAADALAAGDDHRLSEGDDPADTPQPSESSPTVEGSSEPDPGLGDAEDMRFLLAEAQETGNMTLMFGPTVTQTDLRVRVHKEIVSARCEELRRKMDRAHSEFCKVSFVAVDKAIIMDIIAFIYAGTSGRATWEPTASIQDVFDASTTLQLGPDVLGKLLEWRDLHDHAEPSAGAADPEVPPDTPRMLGDALKGIVVGWKSSATASVAAGAATTEEPPKSSCLTFSFEVCGISLALLDYFRPRRTTEEDWISLPLEDRFDQIRGDWALLTTCIKRRAESLPWLAQEVGTEDSGDSWKVEYRGSSVGYCTDIDHIFDELYGVEDAGLALASASAGPGISAHVAFPIMEPGDQRFRRHLLALMVHIDDYLLLKSFAHSVSDTENDMWTSSNIDDLIRASLRGADALAELVCPAATDGTPKPNPAMSRRRVGLRGADFHGDGNTRYGYHFRRGYDTLEELEDLVRYVASLLKQLGARSDAGAVMPEELDVKLRRGRSRSPHSEGYKMRKVTDFVTNNKFRISMSDHWIESGGRATYAGNAAVALTDIGVIGRLEAVALPWCETAEINCLKSLQHEAILSGTEAPAELSDAEALVARMRVLRRLCFLLCSKWDQLPSQAGQAVQHDSLMEEQVMLRKDIHEVRTLDERDRLEVRAAEESVVADALARDEMLCDNLRARIVDFARRVANLY